MMKQLIARAQKGDPEARQRLVAALRPRLTSMARYYARCCHEDYDDLLGEAWFAVFDALGITNLSIGEPDQFLLKRARWRILDYIKWARRRRCGEYEPDREPETTADVAPAVVEEALIAKIAEGLSDTQQAVLQHLLRGETWREVAGHLGCSSANVAYHVRQIRSRAAEVAGELPLNGMAF
jgi:RNA polymerase sigma factor (sigma-70 family)